MKNYKNKNAFTLVELLVAVSIMSIIMVLAIPSIGAIQERNSLRRYKNYGETVISSAKLYTDSNSIDMFGYEEDGCFDVTFEKLVEKNLVKDIDYKDVTCADGSSKRTFVRVKKLDGVYKYQLSMYCADSKGKKAYSDLIADKEPICAGEKSYMGPEIIVSPEKTNGFDKDKDYKVGITIQDDDGLLENNEVDYAWCKKSDCSDVTKYTRLRFENKREAKKTSRKIKRPDEDGEYYFIVKSVVVVDVFNHSTSKTVIKGPYKLDKTPPTCKSSGGRPQWKGSTTAQIIQGECSDNYSGCTEETKIVKQEFTEDEESIKSPGTVYDNAGNSTKCDDQQVKVDTKSPTCKSSGGSSSWVKNASVIGECTNDNLSGCDPTTKNLTVPITETTNDIVSPGVIYDNAGNKTTCGSVKVMVDKTPPTCKVTKSNSGTTAGITVKVECGDAHSGVDKCWTSDSLKEVTKSSIKNDIKYDTSSKSDNNKKYRVVDNVGNVKECSKVTITKQNQEKNYSSCKTGSKNNCYHGSVSESSDCSNSGHGKTCCIDSSGVGADTCGSRGGSWWNAVSDQRGDCITNTYSTCQPGWDDDWTNVSSCKASGTKLCQILYGYK